MTTFTVQIDDANLQRLLSEAPGELAWAVDRAVQRLALEVSRDMKRKAPKATSQLTNSITAGQIALMEWEVGPQVDYASAVEQGRRPGRLPPTQALMDWVKVKGLVSRKTPAADRNRQARDLAWAIARKQAVSGTKPQPFVQPIYAGGHLQNRLLQAVQQAIGQSLGARP